MELPIFELPAVILPGELLPLHIFEERYVRMIGHCLETAEPFGIVFRDDEGNAHRIGCTARVTEVLERFDDGRMNIVVTGEQPFRVLERFDDPDYPAGEVEPISNDEPGEADPEAEDLDIGAEDAYGIAARVELPVETKQALLEQRAESERMRMLGNALRALVAAVSRSNEIAERAKLNGKVIVG
jgi:Lon protease-like protein